MQHLLPLYLILAILPGVAALTVLSALASRYRNRGLTYYLIAYSCFTIAILKNMVMFYLGVNISNEISPGMYGLIFLSFPFSILMQAALPLAVNEVTRPPGKRWIDMTIILFSLAEVVPYCTPLMISYSRESRSILFGPLYPLTGILQIVLIVYSIGMAILRRSSISEPRVRRYVLVLMVIIALFLPAIAYDQFYFLGIESINTVPVALILSPLFYIVLSLASLFFGIQALMMKPGDRAQQIPAGEILRELAESAGLSEREVTIIPLMVRGLGNKQIALELNISAKTVGNHIYNMYRKLDISSRYELLALLK